MNRPILVSLCLTIAGLLHFVTAPERFAHASLALGGFYIALGLFQLILAIGSFLTKNSIWTKTIAYSCCFLFALFVANQLLAGQTSLFVREPYSFPTLFRKFFELLAGALAIIQLQSAHESGGRTK